MFNTAIIEFELDSDCNQPAIILKSYEIAQKTNVVVKDIDFTWCRKKITIKGNKQDRQNFFKQFLSSISCDCIKF
jgi:hypothetical protein